MSDTPLSSRLNVTPMSNYKSPLRQSMSETDPLSEFFSEKSFEKYHKIDLKLQVEKLSKAVKTSSPRKDKKRNVKRNKRNKKMLELAIENLKSSHQRLEGSFFRQIKTWHEKLKDSIRDMENDLIQKIKN